MEQMQIEEKLEAFEQEVIGMKKELSKIPAIEENLRSLTKSLQRLRIQTEENQQLFLQYVETTVKEKSTVSERIATNLPVIKSIVEGGSTPMKRIENEEQRKEIDLEEQRKEIETEEKVSEEQTKKIGIEEDISDRNKFKKVCGKKFDSLIFWTERNLQKYKPIDSERVIVAVIRFDRTTLDWSRSKDEHNAFKDWLRLKQRLLLPFQSVREELNRRRVLANKPKIMEDRRELPARPETKISVKKKLLFGDAGSDWFRWKKKTAAVVWMRRRKKTPANGGCPRRRYVKKKMLP
ncbi:transposon Tf2-1 polyprotein isoform X1 [Cucumis melo var. makuwa]|uniref:Transposon Tf2-1 polyprotein isoform X1 n=1 Tax=Cucumis melo var. makuwa TaxID=1194695 RepID=A0A5A7U0I6_CUCMM|nr:transposon Tf2-1 polyprotein isoform X1 [Cucumis melo var. makuwa]TYK02380.1 transposon Tf2-1 polyprotein isoform X1 [Cucumis melo var. makuwa]